MSFLVTSMCCGLLPIGTDLTKWCNSRNHRSSHRKLYDLTWPGTVRIRWWASTRLVAGSQEAISSLVNAIVMHDIDQLGDSLPTNDVTTCELGGFALRSAASRAAGPVPGRWTTDIRAVLKATNCARMDLHNSEKVGGRRDSSRQHVPFCSARCFSYMGHAQDSANRIHSPHHKCCPPLSQMVTYRGLRLFGHIAHCSSCEDHHRVIVAAIQRPPANWKRPPGRPIHTQGWSETTEFRSCHSVEEDNYLDKRLSDYTAALKNCLCYEVSLTAKLEDV